MKPLISLTKWLHHGVSHFPNLKSDQKSSVWVCVLTARTVSWVSLLDANEIIVKPFEVGRLADLMREKTFGKGKTRRDPTAMPSQYLFSALVGPSVTSVGC
jgi:hypothetical protein